MVVNGPVGEDHIGVLRLQKVMKRVVMGGVNYRGTIDLSSESRTGLENFAGLPGLCYPH